ncbi:MAG: hypothetical protein JSW37_14815, partial [Anaerolineales bacterium]
MFRHRCRLLGCLFTLILVVAASCSPSSPPATLTATSAGRKGSATTPTRTLAHASAGGLVLGESEPLASADIPAAGGGKLVVSSPGHALDG